MIDFLAWHNIVFLSSLSVGVLIAIGAATGGLDMDADIDMDVDGGDVAGGFDAEIDAEGAKQGIMGWLDLGQIPFTVLLMVSSLLFGAVGIAGSFVSVNMFGVDSGWLGWLWVSIAFVVMVVLTGRIARLIVKHIPASETHVISKADLVGVTATMYTSSYADANRGGTVHRLKVSCDTATLEPGMQVVVEDYDPNTKTYVVSPFLPA